MAWRADELVPYPSVAGEDAAAAGQSAGVVPAGAMHFWNPAVVDTGGLATNPAEGRDTYSRWTGINSVAGPAGSWAAFGIEGSATHLGRITEFAIENNPPGPAPARTVFQLWRVTGYVGGPGGVLTGVHHAAPGSVAESCAISFGAGITAWVLDTILDVVVLNSVAPLRMPPGRVTGRRAGTPSGLHVGGGAAVLEFAQPIDIRNTGTAVILLLQSALIAPANFKCGVSWYEVELA